MIVPPKDCLCSSLITSYFVERDTDFGGGGGGSGGGEVSIRWVSVGSLRKVHGI